MNTADQDAQRFAMPVILQVGGLFLAILTTVGIPMLLLAQKVDSHGQRAAYLETRVILLERAVGIPPPSISQTRKKPLPVEE